MIGQISGTNAYEVAEFAGDAPVCHKRGRKCCHCKATVNRYATPTEGYLLCNACLSARSRLDMEVHEFVGGAKKGRGRPAGGKPGRKLPGLAPLMEARGLSNGDLARLAGMDRETVRNLKRCVTRARSHTLAAIAGALEVKEWKLINQPKGNRRAS